MRIITKLSGSKFGNENTGFNNTWKKGIIGLIKNLYEIYKDREQKNYQYTIDIQFPQ